MNYRIISRKEKVIEPEVNQLRRWNSAEQESPLYDDYFLIVERDCSGSEPARWTILCGGELRICDEISIVEASEAMQ